MAMSGIEVDSEVTALFNDMKLRKAHKWATFKLSDDRKKVVIDETGDPDKETDKDEEKFKELLEKLTNEPRYCLFDFNFKNKEGRTINKLAFIFWSDDNNAPMKAKMIYSSTKDTIKKTFTGLGLEFQANDLADFDYKAWRAEVEKKA